jgi:ubiquinone/menaquinone biosynthesis C-methylase UbiE
MIARAAAKASKAGAAVDFRVAVVESLPYPDARFDVVLSTLMLHHLPRAAREQGVREMRRVLRPGGRVLAVDFGRGNVRAKRGLIAHFHRHGGVALRDIVALLEGGGLRVIDSGAVGTKGLQFALATA